jgi:hypothetical protein
VQGLISKVGDLACGEVETPKVPKVDVNHGCPISEDTCKQIMYSGVLEIWKKLGVEVKEWGTLEVPNPCISFGSSIGMETHRQIIR